MKKKILLILLLFFTLTVTGCTTKEKLESSNFKKIMEKKEFVVVDNTKEALSEIGSVEMSYKATEPSGRYILEYYSFDGEVSAQGFYAKKQAELGTTGSQVYTELNQGNYSKYTMLYHDKFTAIARVSNTIIYVTADKNYQDEIKKILLDIGY